MNTMVAHVTAIAVDEEYRMLCRKRHEYHEWRRWYATTGRRLFGHRWDDLAAINDARITDIELMITPLVRIRWAARRASRQARQAVA